MKLVINENQISMAPEQFLRQAGYAYIRERESGQASFVRRLGGNFYPRLHMYVEQEQDKIIFNLHLDQKQPSYAGSHAHNAEYEGEVVEDEMRRLKLIAHKAESITTSLSQAGVAGQDILDKIRPKQFSAISKEEEKKSWWRRFFA